MIHGQAQTHSWQQLPRNIAFLDFDTRSNFERNLSDIYCTEIPHWSSALLAEPADNTLDLFWHLLARDSNLINFTGGLGWCFGASSSVQTSWLGPITMFRSTSNETNEQRKEPSPSHTCLTICRGNSDLLQGKKKSVRLWTNRAGQFCVWHLSPSFTLYHFGFFFFFLR